MPFEELFDVVVLMWTSLVTQIVENLPATWETPVQYLDWEDPLRRGAGNPL